MRDLLLERQPKDFDIGTSAHPQQVRKLFRNCFIIGRRFRLAHVRFGRKVIEVSTFRRQAEPEEGDTLIRRDNTFGSPEEDAFRRDFTVNALFYDIATFSVIDYVDGLEDLTERVIRTIGDPEVRFREDPVRMLRAVALAARLDFTIDPDTAEAIRFLRGEIVRSSPARLLEELYKILRQGRSRAHLRDAARARPARVPAARGGPRDRRGQAGARGLAGAARRPPPGRARDARPAHERAADGLAARAARRAAAARGGRRAGAARRRSSRRPRPPSPPSRSRRARSWPPRSPSSARRTSPSPPAIPTPRRCSCRSRGATSSGCGCCCSRSAAARGGRRRSRRASRSPPRATSRTPCAGSRSTAAPDGRELGARWRELPKATAPAAR